MWLTGNATRKKNSSLEGGASSDDDDPGILLQIPVYTAHCSVRLCGIKIDSVFL